MGFFSDLFSDPIGAVVDLAEDTGDFIYDAQKGIIDVGRNAVDQTLADVDDMAKASGENLWDNFAEFPFKTAKNILTDPTDINSYSDSISDWYNVNDDYSEELYGTGGWKKAGLNFLSTGNPMYGAGDITYQANSALNGDQYSNGLTAGPKTLMSMYNIGSSIADMAGSTPPSTEMSPTNSVNANMEPQIQDFNYDTAYDTGAVAQDGLLNYGGTAGSYSPILGASTSAPSYDFSSLSGAFNALKDFSQSQTGKLGSIAMGALGPEAGLIGSGMQSIGTNDWNPFVKGLAQMYLSNKAKSNMDRYTGAITDRIAALDRQYSMDGDIAAGLERRLARRDAASGRRSQYGARNTELAAKLAELRAQQEVPVLNALSNANMLKAQQERTVADNQRMQTLMALWDQYNKPQFTAPPTATTTAGTGLNMNNINLSNIWK